MGGSDADSLRSGPRAGHAIVEQPRSLVTATESSHLSIPLSWSLLIGRYSRTTSDARSRSRHQPTQPYSWSANEFADQLYGRDSRRYTLAVTARYRRRLERKWKSLGSIDDFTAYRKACGSAIKSIRFLPTTDPCSRNKHSKSAVCVQSDVLHLSYETEFH